MNSSSLRYLLLKSYFPVAVLAAIVMAILDVNTPSVAGQYKTITVTVFVTLVQTVPIYVPVTAYVTVASIATSFITFTTTAVSVSLGAVTLWNTITAVTTAVGIFGSTPITVFGPFSDLALTGGGVSVGAAATAASLKLLSRGRLPSTGKPRGIGMEPREIPDYAAIAAQADRLNQLLPSAVKEKAGGIVQVLEHYDPSTSSDLEKTVAREVRKKFNNLTEAQTDVVSAYVLNQNVGITIQGLKSLLDDLKGLDDTDELTEMTSLQLQMTMDRRSKFIATLSNIMKKIGTTQEAVTQNLK